MYRDKKSVSDRSGRAYGSVIRKKVNCCAMDWVTPVDFSLMSLLTARRNILQACFTVSLRTSPSRKWWWKSSAGGMVICALLDIFDSTDLTVRLRNFLRSSCCTLPNFSIKPLYYIFDHHHLLVSEDSPGHLLWRFLIFVYQ